jgi:hypothetical protein
MKDHTHHPAKELSREFTSQEKSDALTLMRFVEIYCREKHLQEKSPFTFNKITVKSKK